MSEAKATNICCEQPRCPGFLCACIGKQYDALVARNKKLEAAIQNALFSFAICKLPQLDASVASNEDLLKITEAGLRAALTEEK